MDDLTAYVETLGRSARRAAAQLTTVSGATKSDALRRMAAALRGGRDELLEANARDVDAAGQARLEPALVERLKLNVKRVESMAASVEQIAEQVDPVGQIIE